MDLHTARPGGAHALPECRGDIRPVHVVAKDGREVIDRMRVDEANHPFADKPGRRVVKTSRWLLGMHLVEGINSMIKVIKRMAYGFRDNAYFFLGIRAAFPGPG